MCHTIEPFARPFHPLAAIDDQRMEIEYQDEDASISDSESCVSGPTTSASFSRPDLFHGGLTKLDEDEDRVYNVISQRFLSSLGQRMAPRTTVVSIHKKNWSGSSASIAKAQSFQIHRRLMEKQAPGDVNSKFAWFGTSRDGVERIMSHGFGLPELNQSNGLYGCGVYLSPDHFSCESVQSADVDEDGLRYMVLCRVLLGRMEVVHPYSDQTHPSSEEFDSGVDSLESPKKYIVWSTNMNTHILPEYVVSFRAPLHSGSGKRELIKKPTSPWMPFPPLIHELDKFLPAPSVGLIYKYHRDYKERRIQRTQLIQHVRKLAGDKLLMAVIKSWRAKLATSRKHVSEDSFRQS